MRPSNKNINPALSAVISFALIFSVIGAEAGAAAKPKIGGNISVGASFNTSSGMGAAMLRCMGVQTPSLSGIFNAAKNALSGIGAGGIGSTGVDMTGTQYGSGLTENFESGNQAANEAGVSLDAFGPDTGGATAGLGAQAAESAGQGLSGLFGGAGSVLPGASMVMGLLGGGGGPIPTDPMTIKPAVDAMKQKDTCWDALANAEAKNMLGQLNAEVARWINTGFNGNPFYPKNMGDYYQNIANNQTNILLGQIKSSNNPMASRIIPSVVRANQNPTPNSFGDSIRDYLPKIAGNQNAANRYRQGDPSACPGQLEYQCLAAMTRPGSSSLFTQIATKKELDRRQAEAKEQADKELLMNGGMASQKKCDSYDSYGNCSHWSVTTPGAFIRVQGEKAVTSAQEALSGNVGDTGQGSILGALGNATEQMFDDSFFGTTETGGAYANASADTQGLMTSIVAAESNTTNYLETIDRSLILTKKLEGEIREVQACYLSLDNYWDSTNGSPRPSSGNPSAGDYQILLGGQYSETKSGFQALISSLRNTLGSISYLRAEVDDAEDEETMTNLNAVFASLAQDIPNKYMLAQAIDDLQIVADKESITAVNLKDCQNKLAAAKLNVANTSESF